MAGAALGFYPQGEFFWGTVVITCFVFSDLIDGTMARMSERSSRWGAWLDSTLDRIGDARGLRRHRPLVRRRRRRPCCCAPWRSTDCLPGAVVSYARARAEGLGMTADVGITERADRLVVVLVATGLEGLGVPLRPGARALYVAVGSTVTIVQRGLAVRRQALADISLTCGPHSSRG